MDFEVRFRFNKLTGEVEIFDVDDINSGLPLDEHNAQHDRVASEIGRLVDRAPNVVEISEGARAADQSITSMDEQPSDTREEKEKDKGRSG